MKILKAKDGTPYAIEFPNRTRVYPGSVLTSTDGKSRAVKKIYYDENIILFTKGDFNNMVSFGSMTLAKLLGDGYKISNKDIDTHIEIGGIITSEGTSYKIVSFDDLKISFSNEKYAFIEDFNRNIKDGSMTYTSPISEKPAICKPVTIKGNEILMIYYRDSNGNAKRAGFGKRRKIFLTHGNGYMECLSWNSTSETVHTKITKGTKITESTIAFNSIAKNIQSGNWTLGDETDHGHKESAIKMIANSIYGSLGNKSFITEEKEQITNFLHTKKKPLKQETVFNWKRNWTK